MARDDRRVRFCEMRCSRDLCQRVVEFVRSGGSKTEAARRFHVDEARMYRWLKPGGLTYQRPCPRRPSKLDWERVRGYGEVHPDRLYPERARHFHVFRHCIWLVIMDNAAFRTSPETVQLIAATGATLLFLAPYSPDLNPIEHDFAALKKRCEYQDQGTLNNMRA